MGPRAKDRMRDWVLGWSTLHPACMRPMHLEEEVTGKSSAGMHGRAACTAVRSSP